MVYICAFQYKYGWSCYKLPEAASPMWKKSLLKRSFTCRYKDGSACYIVDINMGQYFIKASISMGSHFESNMAHLFSRWRPPHHPQVQHFIDSWSGWFVVAIDLRGTLFHFGITNQALDSVASYLHTADSLFLSKVPDLMNITSDSHNGLFGKWGIHISENMFCHKNDDLYILFCQIRVSVLHSPASWLKLVMALTFAHTGWCQLGI